MLKKFYSKVKTPNGVKEVYYDVHVFDNEELKSLLKSTELYRNVADILRFHHIEIYVNGHFYWTSIDIFGSDNNFIHTLIEELAMKCNASYKHTNTLKDLGDLIDFFIETIMKFELTCQPRIPM